MTKMEMSGTGAEFYDAVTDRIGFPDEIPDGLISHGACATPTGWLVCDIWQSEQQFSAFVESKLGAALQEAAQELGITTEIAPPQIFEAHAALARDFAPVHA
ncbi:MAG: hypothetical protein HY827_03580 [Actinobacteria bacterium]|nr:hypothetical protein [Actinomycetota bacterium]